MKSLKTLFTTLAVTAVAAGGLLVAQNVARPHHGHEQFHARMAAALGLTDQQKAQAKAIFQDARTQAQPIRQSLKEERQSIQAAVKAGKSPAEIQAMASNEGTQLGQLAGIRAAAMAKFYAVLTPDQQQKLASMRQNRHGRHQAPEAPPSSQN